ncbi:DUF3846 domain-containing protein [Geodermatophilus sp. SYSU D00697]
MTVETPGSLRVVVFPTDPDERVAVTTIEHSDLGLWRALGNGRPQSVYLPDLPRTVLVCNEDGKAKGLDPNPRATRFVDRWVPGFARVDRIVGPCLVAGITDDDFADASDEAVTAALAEQTHRDHAPAWQDYSAPRLSPVADAPNA